MPRIRDIDADRGLGYGARRAGGRAGKSVGIIGGPIIGRVAMDLIITDAGALPRQAATP